MTISCHPRKDAVQRPALNQTACQQQSCPAVRDNASFILGRENLTTTRTPRSTRPLSWLVADDREPAYKLIGCLFTLTNLVTMKLIGTDQSRFLIVVRFLAQRESPGVFVIRLYACGKLLHCLECH